MLDPVDGSTNASRGIPWLATSLCAVDRDGPSAAVVLNLASGARFEAVRGAGATLDGDPIRPSACASMAGAIVAISGYPPHRLGWYQFRALGAAALDVCAVAAGTVDAYVDCSPSAHAPWDYLGALLICRTPVAAATPALFEEALAARAAFRV